MKTVYDWYPGKRWRLLVPKGTTSIQQTVVVSDALGYDVFRLLYDHGRLTGKALADARLKFEGKVEKGA